MFRCNSQAHSLPVKAIPLPVRDPIILAEALLSLWTASVSRVSHPSPKGPDAHIGQILPQLHERLIPAG